MTTVVPAKAGTQRGGVAAWYALRAMLGPLGAGGLCSSAKLLVRGGSLVRLELDYLRAPLLTLKLKSGTTAKWDIA